MTGSLPRYADKLASLHLRHDTALADHARRAASLARSAGGLQRAVLQEHLESAALLTDIGTSPDLERVGFPPLDGALYLASIGWPDDIVRLVAYFAFSQQYARYFGVDHQLAVIEPIAGLAGEILVWSDLNAWEPDPGNPASGQSAIAWRMDRAIGDPGSDQGAPGISSMVAASDVFVPRRTRERLRSSLARAVGHVDRALARPRGHAARQSRPRAPH